MSLQTRANKKSEVHLGFQIAPMIDVVFVIMLYFMVMAGAVKIEKSHTITLPTHGDTPLNDEIVIRVEDDGQVFLNEDPLDDPNVKKLTELTANLQQLKDGSDAVNARLIVTICANENARYDRVVDVMDALSTVKIPEVSFQTAALE